MNKKRQLKNQKRKARRGLKGRKRRKEYLRQRNTGKPIKKIISKEITTKGLPWKVRIKFYFLRVIQKIKRAGCFIGLHDWKICSGRERDPMHTCIKCWKGSTKKWGKGGSANYYDKKYKDKLGITDTKNWEKKGNDWYFKGEYIKLNKDERRRLKVVLGNKKKKNNGKN